jgi:AraC-like DNA-binding protein
MTSAFPVSRGNPSSSTDPLSCVLRSFSTGGARAGVRTFAGSGRGWVQEGSAVQLYLVERGCCRLEIDGVPESMSLAPGGLALLARGRRHRLRGPSMENARVVCGRAPAGGRNTCARRAPVTAQAVLVWGSIPLEPENAFPFLVALPPVAHLGQGEAATISWMRSTMCLAADQWVRRGPGAQAIVDLLLESVLVQALRLHVATLPRGLQGRLAALNDPAIGPTIGLMHARPEAPWTVASLAAEVGLSRSAYAERFAELTGTSPMRYLLDCRMQTASRFLRAESAGLKEIASRVAYASEPAFSVAFKRWSGRSPGAYRAVSRGASS